MERSNEQDALVIANTYSTGDTIIVDGYRYRCKPCVPAMQRLSSYQIWRYFEHDSIQKWDDMAKVRTA